MTRSEIVDLLAERFTHLTQRDSESAVTTILDALSNSMARGHRIEIRGFGSFSITRRAPRLGRNPRSGESVSVPEKRATKFKPGKALKDSVGQRTVELADRKGL
jgi:integration host factor subunit beta